MMKVAALLLCFSQAQAALRAPVRVNAPLGSAGATAAAGAALALPAGQSFLGISAHSDILPVPALAIGQSALQLSESANGSDLSVGAAGSLPARIREINESKLEINEPVSALGVLELSQGARPDSTVGTEVRPDGSNETGGVSLQGREAKKLSKRIVDLQGRLLLEGWLQSAAKLDQNADGPQDSSDPAIMGRALMDAVIPKLLGNRAGRNIGEAARQVPIPTFLFSPDIRKDALRPNQAALYEGVPNSISINRNFVGFSRDQWSQFLVNHELRERAAEVLAPTVLHELKHWRTRILTGDIALRENEYEAHHVQALFILERLLEDPDYLKNLPPAFSQRYVGLLQAWLEGPQALASYVGERYSKVPMLFGADPEAMIAENEGQIAGWRDRLENYDLRKRELSAEIEKSKRIESALAGERITMGGSRSDALASELNNFPSRELTRVFLMQLEDALDFWKNPTRLLITKKYYEVVLKRMYEEWKGWKAEHPDFVLPLPPTAWQRFTAWLGSIFSRA